MDMPVGNWSNENDYPQGAEIYTSDIHGGDVKRLTYNKKYDAEVSVSPNGEWIVWGRQVDGKMDLWRMRSDGSDKQQITFYPRLAGGRAVLFARQRNHHDAGLETQRIRQDSPDADDGVHDQTRWHRTHRAHV